MHLILNAAKATIIWENPTNKKDSRFDPTTGKLKSGPKNDTSLEIKIYKLPAVRSSLRDRNGIYIAYDVNFPRPAIWLSSGSGKEILKDFEDNLYKLNSLLNRNFSIAHYPPQFFEERRGSPVVLNEALSPNEIERLTAKKESRIQVVHTSARHYPYSDILAHICGWATILPELSLTHLYNPPYGKSGLESIFNKLLTPRAGTLEILKDAADHTLKQLYQNPAEKPTTLTVTVDAELQKKVLLKIRSKLKEGVVLVADSATGEIPVLLSLPSFDPNRHTPFADIKYKQQLLEDKTEPLSNRIFRDYKGVDIEALSQRMRFESDFSLNQYSASRNCARLLNKESFISSSSGLTPLYLLNLIQTLTHSAPLTLLSPSNPSFKKSDNSGFDELGNWNYIDFFSSATREGQYMKADSEVLQIKNAHVYIGSSRDRNFNFVLISEESDATDETLLEIKNSIEEVLLTNHK